MKYNDIAQASQAIEILEGYLGDTPTYTGYGTTLGQALSRYSTPFHVGVKQGEIFDASGVEIVIPENQIVVNYLTSDIKVGELLEDSVFSVRPSSSHTTTDGSSVRLINTDETGKVIKEETYELRIFDASYNSFRVTHRGDFVEGYFYWFYFSGSYMVINGIDSSAVSQQMGMFNAFMADTGNSLEFYEDTLYLGRDGAHPTLSLYANDISFRRAFESNLGTAASIRFDASGLRTTGNVDFLNSVVKGRDAVEANEFVTKQQMEAKVAQDLSDALDNRFLTGSQVPSENTSIDENVPVGTVYFQVGQE